MRTNAFSVYLILFILVNCTGKDTITKPSPAEVKPVTDVYYGVKITDPYRYMENLQDTAVQQWLKAQSDYSRNILNRIPGRKGLIDKMVEFDSRLSTQVSSLFITDNDRYFYLKTTPADETGKLFYRDGFEGNEVLLFDPETYGTDTTQKYVISEFSPSIDGSKTAIEVAPNGSESSIMLIMEVDTKELYPEQIDRCWLSGASWLPDNRSFLFNRLQSSDVHDINRELNSKTYLHQLGTDPSNDKEILSASKYPELGIKPEEIPVVLYEKNCQYLVGILATVDNRLNAFYSPVSELGKNKISWKRLFTPEDEVYNYYATDQDIYVYTPHRAPNFEILKISLAKPDMLNAEIIVPEDPERKLTDFGLTSEGLFYTLTENGVKATLHFLPNGSAKSQEVGLPLSAGTIEISTKGMNFNDIWIDLTGWTNDLQRYRYLTTANEFRKENLSTIPEYPEYDDLVVEELMIPSHDGIPVPLSLIYKKGTEKTGNNPVFMYGYGAYGIPIDPFFNPRLLLWTYERGILAIPHVRGGGELGDAWYKGGYKTTKPNTWKDLIACAEYLVREQYTSSQKIAINSGSAGGILIGRAMTERPDLFAVTIPQVGCMNTVRLEKSPNGPVNVSEFGTVKDSVECMSLIEMDSYLHIEDGVQYPATLITAGMNDPRVVAWQPAKFTARLEAANASDKPVLFWVDYEAGHGIGNTKTKSYETMADVLSFALWQTGNPDFKLK